MDEIVELLNSAKHEILMLRRDNEIMHAKIEVMDLFAVVLHTKPAQHSRSETPDIAWAIDKKLDELRSATSLGKEESSCSSSSQARPFVTW